MPPLVLDGEIALPEERGVTHIGLLTQAMRQYPERLTCFAFGLLHLEGHDLRGCAIEDRKALLRDIVGAAKCGRIIVVDYITSNGAASFEACARSAPRASSQSAPVALIAATRAVTG